MAVGNANIMRRNGFSLKSFLPNFNIFSHNKRSGVKLIDGDHRKLSFKRHVRIYFSNVFRVIFLFLLLFMIFVSYFDFKFCQKIRVRTWRSFVDVTGEIGFRLDNIVIVNSNENSHVKATDLLNSIEADSGTPIIGIDIKEARTKLLQNGWIKDVTIYRRLPDTIMFYITERIPMAIWQNNHKLYVIDDNGEVITDAKVNDYTHFIHVVGDDANAYARSFIDIVRHDLSLSSKIISASRLGGRRWNIYFQEGVVVKMPESDFQAAWSYLQTIHAADKLFGQEYKSIDLRNKDKYFFEKTTAIRTEEKKAAPVASAKKSTTTHTSAKKNAKKKQ